MRRVVLVSAQLAFIVAGYLGFFGLTPWLGCHPLNQLPAERQSALIVPADARCFTYNHGEVSFHRHGLASEEPARFALHVAAFALPLSLLIWSVVRAGRWQRWASGGEVPGATQGEASPALWLAGFVALALALSFLIARLAG
jgi:hypothetical protein